MRLRWISTGIVGVYVLTGCTDAVSLGRRCTPGAVLCADAGPRAPEAGQASADTSVAPPSAQDAAAITSGAAPLTPPVERFGIEPGDRAAFCQGQGSALRILSNGAQARCHPGIGRRLFAYGVCSCSDVALNGGAFALDAFDSRLGAYAAASARSGAALGVNGELQVAENQTLRLGGSLIVAGGGSLQLGAASTFGGDVKTHAVLDLQQALEFPRDVWTDADIRGDRQLKVARDLYQTPGRSGAQMLDVGGQIVVRDFSIKPPCACGPGLELDVADIVTQALLESDNVELGLGHKELSELLSQGNLPANMRCGRYALSSTSLPADSLSKLSGRLALFVAGDLNIQGNFATELGATAELDVFVSGNLTIGQSEGALAEGFTGSANLGMPERPTAVRLYVAGTQSIYINDAIRFAAQLYAPHATVKATSIVTTHTYGALFAQRVESLYFNFFHYDLAVLEPGGACQRDADCCEPMVCRAGACGPLTELP